MKTITNISKTVIIYSFIVITNIAIAFETVYFNQNSPEQALDDISLYLNNSTGNCKIELLIFVEATST